MRPSSAEQRARHPVRHPGREVGEREQVASHDQRITPRVRLALHDDERRQALRREDVPREQRQRRREAPGVRDHRHQRRRDVALGRERVDRAERADGDLACREARHQRERDLPVEPERREHDFERAADHAGEAVHDRGPFGARRRRRVAAQEPQHDHQREDDRADALQEHLGPLPQADRQVVEVRPVVFGQFEQQRVIRRAQRRALQQERDCHRRDDAGEVQREQHDALQVERADRAATG